MDLCSDSFTLNMSPRYSFSHDLSSKSDNNILPLDHLRRPSFGSLSNLEFDFNVRETTLDHHSSSADELFSDGMIRSVQIKKDVLANNSSSSSQQKEHHNHKSSENIITKKTYVPPPHTVPDQDDDHDLKTTLESSENQKQNSSKSSSSSFWGFKRSSSYNCGSGSGSGGYASSLCPLPLLSRSNSAGSASADSSTKRNHQKLAHSQKHSSSSFGSIKSNSQGSSSNYQKPPLKKGVYGSFGSNNTLLHVPSASVFGFGSIFSNGKVKNIKATR